MSRLRTSAAPHRLLLAVVLALSGCASGRVNLWPLYFHEVREVQTDRGPERVTSTDVVYPFFSRESGPDGTWHVLRPFYNYQVGPEPGRRRVQYLWPLGLHFVSGSEVRHRLFPFFDYNKTWSERLQRHSVHAHVLQIIRWGDHAELGPYFALFPLGGWMHGVIGRTWTFVVFPFYSRYTRGTYVRHDFPWPILGYGRSEDGTRSMYRFWPFYVSQREDSRTGKYVRYDLLWPFARWGRVDRGGRYYHTVLAVVPLLSRINTYDRQGRQVARRTSVLGFGSSAKPEGGTGTSGWTALWSLVRKSDGPKVDEFRIFPFYWRKTYYHSTDKDPQRSWTRVRAPWPLLWIDSDRMTEPGVHKVGITLAPLYWDQSRKEPAPDGTVREGRKITLWPLLTWEREPDGGRHVWVASHGWKDESQGYKRNYRALLDFFQYHRTAGGERETRVLSRLYHHRRGPGGRYLSVMGLFTYDSTAEVVGEEGTYFSALFGLIKRSWTKGGRRWRILYIPLGGASSGPSEVNDGRHA